MSRALISLNSGSSSIKFGLYTLDDGGPRHAAGGKLEGIGTDPRILVRKDDGEVLLQKSWPGGAGLTHEDLLGELYGWAQDHLREHEIVAVGHRVVHGGGVFRAPQRIDAALVVRLEAFSPLAPLHQPHNLAAICEIARMAPHLLQVACFDTAFHHAMPPVATRLPLPRRFAEQGVRRYGFHGLSYEYIARRLGDIDAGLAKGRVIVAHLGNGASLCAMRVGASIDTTMGFTALDGLMMGTRSGALDPGAVLHLMLQEGMSAHEVEALLYGQSGLLGVSGISGDMRVLHASADPHAKEAIELFVWTVARQMAALIGSLEGLDGIVFTAGIGENDPVIRSAICARMAWAGVLLDEAANAANAPVISRPDSRIAVRVIPTDEERMIAFHTFNMLDDQQGARA
ncbi:acetate/propionate family kinase [Novosphingobium sp. KACC 22771]|uniref:acetate/propionate family kinase n=1 Tax=Novosphingobium sp. KACC 22771 TaxID=3025670 RepID=UPI00236593E1|nr:acetate/propionate family kinase [Novosphingobium sp. KACC 22771]WDF71417.1 acetate/propionate family kinase [Novosphingobium sp. KACC 22771]